MKADCLALVFSAALVLFACATPPSYGPATSARSIGYSDSAIETDRYRVTYRGGDQATAHDFALLRAADLTLAKGHDWFRVTNASIKEEGDSSGTSISVGGSTGSYRGRSSTGVGVGIGFPLGTSRVSEQTLEILMSSGPRPDGSNVYDAKSVSESIGAKIGGRVD